MAALLPAFIRLRRARRGLAGIEFALVVPVLLGLLAGIYDLATAYILWGRINMCAQAIGQIATATAANSAATNTLTLLQATTSASAMYVYLTNSLGAAPGTFGVTLSSVAMTPTVAGCTANCTYTAHVAWSGNYAGTAGSQRPCDTVPGVPVIVQSANNAALSPDTLPVGVYSAASLLVVDVSFTYTPVFYRFLASSFVMHQSSYFPPRAGLGNNWIAYHYAAPDSTTLCAGYPSA